MSGRNPFFVPDHAQAVDRDARTRAREVSRDQAAQQEREARDTLDATTKLVAVSRDQAAQKEREARDALQHRTAQIFHMKQAQEFVAKLLSSITLLEGIGRNAIERENILDASKKGKLEQLVRELTAKFVPEQMNAWDHIVREKEKARAERIASTHSRDDR